MKSIYPKAAYMPKLDHLCAEGHINVEDLAAEMITFVCGERID